MTPKELSLAADQIYKRYADFYGSELVQGVELLIAEEMAHKLGGKIISGILTVNGIKHVNYWINVHGVILDPIFKHVRTVDLRATREETEGGETELRSNIERYRIYQI